MAERIRIFGDHDEGTLAQLHRCVEAEEGAHGVLCADGHLGYSAPIGGVIAYREHLSPSGAGYDIGCIAAGTPVTSPDGWHAPIERIGAGEFVTCWDGAGCRPVDPNLGAVTRGTRAVVRLALAGGRAVVATPDHLVRTKLGWRRIDQLRIGEAVAASPFVGLAREPAGGELGLSLPRLPAGRRVDVDREAWLRDRGLWPVRPDDHRFPALLRVLGYAAGDGHLAASGNRVSLYTSIPEDALDLRGDLRSLGVDAGLDIRRRGAGVRTQYVVRAGSVGLHALLAALGCPVGRKVAAWAAEPFPWLFELPGWMRAHFLSAFASAEATTPALTDGRIGNVAMKQAGETTNAIDFVARLAGSLGFRVGVTRSGPSRGAIHTHAAQILGGQREQVRFLEQVGFCRAIEKRRAAAAMLSIAAQRAAETARRQQAIADAAALKAAGAGRVRDVVAATSAVHDVPPALVHHGLYGRGAPRVPKGWTCEPDSSNEVAWLRVEAVEAAGVAPVFDVATADRAESFLGGGIVVHNCGNKATLTNLRADDIRPDLPRIMDEVVRRIEFGVGRTNERRVDHPILDEIRAADFRPQRNLHDLAAQQLGTVGAGNHYCDLFADEQDRVWVGVHFGSRGFGHRTASGFLSLAQGGSFSDRGSEGGMDAPPTLLHEDTELGQAYLSAMTLAGRYAFAGRDVVVDELLRILGAEALDDVHNNHNWIWRERHDDEEYWVVRKGATPAFPGQRGFVGASMAEPAVILEGVDSRDSRDALFSTIHGAGRAMSRTKAAGKVRKRWRNDVRDDETLYESRQAALAAPGAKKASPVRVREGGAVDFAAVRRKLAAEGIELRGGAADEAPAAYKRLPEVLAHHAGTVRVLHTLTPLGVAMAGPDTYDPYKD